MKTYEQDGILVKKDLDLPSDKQLEKRIAITECVQLIPCNPCVDSCPADAISMKDINAPPVVDYDACIGCGNCVGACPGLAIFLLKITDEKAEITLPYEFQPIPNKDDVVHALNRTGAIVDKGLIKKVRKKGKTAIITVQVNKEFVYDVRNIKPIN